MGLIRKAILAERPLSYETVREIAKGNARVLALLTGMIETSPDTP